MPNHTTIKSRKKKPVDNRQWYDRIYSHSSLDNPVKCIIEERTAYCTYSAGGSLSAATLTIGCIAKRINNLQNKSRPILFIVAHMDDADEALDELTTMGIVAKRFPALEILPGETGVSPELLSERLATVRYAINLKNEPDSQHNEPAIIIAPIPALMQAIPIAEKLDDFSLNLSISNSQHNPGSILAWLEAAGYNRVESIEMPGEFAVRGGIIDIFPAAGGSSSSSSSSSLNSKTSTAASDETLPVRLDFFDDELESICEVDPDTMASDRRIEHIQIIGADISSLLSDEHTTGFWDVLPENTVVILHELMEINEQGRGYYERALSATGIYGTPAVLKALNSSFTLMQLDQHPIGASDPDTTFHLPFQALPVFSENPQEAIAELADLAREGLVLVFCLNEAEKDRFTQLLYENIENPTNIEPIVSYIYRGFIWNPQQTITSQPTTDTNKQISNITALVVVPYNELLHRFQTRRKLRRLRAGRAMDTFLDLQPGDYVVHRDHGIAKFLEFGVKSIDKSKRLPVTGKDKSRKAVQDNMQEYLTLEFMGGSRLHVPATKIDLVQKYVGGFHGRPPLSKLGGKKWSNQKDKVSEAVRDLASELLRLQAAREHLPGVRYPDDTQWQHQFEAEFPYEETEDQLASLVEIKNDMSRDRPMDRLLCGDVGFGKTELAIRAAFKTAEFGKQVAILVPTTVLAEQHARTFKQRFADFPFSVEVISRFQTNKQCKSVLESLKRGQVDIIIGTHRLLSKDVVFADLGLVIIDEEQRFGVEHKKHLLSFRMTADVLTLSATPIPRTLHMSMLGLRDISSLTTAPLDRRAVVTEVIPYNENRIKQAIQRELAREGQVYFVHNRVYNIKSVADNIQKLVPNARIIVGHGQMADRELEKVMVKFIRGHADILVSTTIIESGIDIPNANTMFINDANRFGLADLHQLRGRVGRYKHRAYCYMLLTPDARVTTVATKRLKAIEEYSMLGAGFRIAMRDLEIRGAGNLLGAEQSGHIAAVGYEMYCQLLEQTVKELKNERDVKPIDTEVELKINGSITKGYIPSDIRRMEAYRRISQARSVPELDKIRLDLTDAYGQPPNTTDTLLHLAEIRIKAALMNIKSISLHEQDIIFKSTDPAPLAAAFETAPGSVRVLEPRFPNHPMEIYFRPPENFLEPTSLLAVLRKRLQPVPESDSK